MRSNGSCARYVLAVGLVLTVTVMLAQGARGQAFTGVAPGVEVSPPPGAMVEGGQALEIRLSGDAALSIGGVRIAVDGTDVSEQARRAGDRVSIRLPATLSGGLHRVRLLVPTLTAAPREVEWSFQAPAPVTAELRDSEVKVASNAEKTLYEADTLEVYVDGPAGGHAVASVGSISFALSEQAPGHYQGSYDIKREDGSVTAPVRVRIALREGRVVGNRSNKKLKIFGRMFTVRVDSPANNSRVPYDFVIKGRTRPNARVSITPALGQVSTSTVGVQNGGQAPIPGHVNRGMGGWDVIADEHGYFEQKFGFPIHIVDISYSFLLTATDESGEQAIPSTLHVTLTKPSSPTKN